MIDLMNYMMKLHSTDIFLKEDVFVLIKYFQKKGAIDPPKNHSSSLLTLDYHPKIMRKN